ncbi:MAG: hypothetical protein SGJ18_03920 [Pseudomonadota bacterium]|nr:hypothetical protein [Pseudomonadota bacterium]
MRVLVLLLITALVTPSHSETVKTHDPYLSYIFNYVTAQYWTVKNADQFIKVFGSNLSKSEKDLVKKRLGQIKVLPELLQYENGWIVKLDGFKITVDVRQIRNKIAYFNGEKFHLDPGSNLEFQIELMQRKLLKDSDKFGYLWRLLLPAAKAEGEGSVMGFPSLKKWVLYAVVYKIVEKGVDSITSETVTKIMDGFCWGSSDFASNVGMCKDYLKRLKEELAKNPTATAVADAKKIPESARKFFTLTKTCLHESKTNTLRATFVLLAPEFLEKDEHGDIKERIFRAAAEQKGDELMTTRIYENKTNEIAVYEYHKNILKMIKIPNDKFDEKTNGKDTKSVQLPYINIPATDELGKNDGVEIKQNQKFHNLINEHIGSVIKKCSDELIETQNKQQLDDRAQSAK